MPTKKRLITPQDLYALQSISDVQLSPAGRHVIYAAQRVDPKTEKKYTNLWLAPLEGGEPRQFTYGDHSDSQPRWSADGSQIAFLSNRADPDLPARLYLLPFGGGEARPLSQIEGSLGDFAWSPDGRQLACQVRKTDPEARERQQDEQKKKLGVVARHYDRLFFKLDGFGYLPKERWHLWLVDARTGKARQLTDHPVWDEGPPAWSPDGKWLAFTSNRSPEPDQTPDREDLFVLPVGRGAAEMRRIEAPIGPKARPSFSPDGRWLAYFGVEGEGQDYRNLGLWVVPLDGSAPARNLTAPHDLHASAWTINDIGAPAEQPPTWSADGQRLYFTASLHGDGPLMAIGRDGSHLRNLSGSGGVVFGYSADAARRRLACLYGDPTDPTQVRLLEAEQPGAPRRLLSHNQALLQQLDLGTLEENWIKGPAGNDLQGWILKPPGFDPARKYPSILEIHGGPLLQYGNLFMHEFYYLAAGGYVVHFCNPRGGRGYGEEHAKALCGGWGGADYADLMAWSDHVQALPYIDPARMGVTGGSYGGYMTVWIIGHTQRFKAAVTQRCVSNFVSLWGSSDFNWYFQQTLNNQPPFTDLQTYWDHSPMKYIGNAKTPTLVIHNEMDLRCPIEQGEQVYVALKRLGVPTEFVRFPEEFHGLSRGGRTDRRMARLKYIKGWFDRFLQSGDA
jgi:dipeptidyl aminopeptidase/acylaminoacyl peptidase